MQNLLLVSKMIPIGCTMVFDPQIGGSSFFFFIFLPTSSKSWSSLPVSPKILRVDFPCRPNWKMRKKKSTPQLLLLLLLLLHFFIFYYYFLYFIWALKYGVYTISSVLYDIVHTVISHCRYKTVKMGMWNSLQAIAM